jgi:hypothetical protein
MEAHRESLEEEGTHATDEARMVLPGVQAILGFQLIAVFNQRFEQLGVAREGLHLAAFVLVAAAMGLLMAPAAYHRQAERGRITRRFVDLASRLLTLAMVPLLIGIVIDTYLISWLVVRQDAASVAIAGGLAITLGGLWFGIPCLGKKVGAAHITTGSQRPRIPAVDPALCPSPSTLRCDMPSREKPDAIALLKADHRAVEDLFAKFEKARDADRKQALVTEICTELMIHATIEEEIFYPACKDQIKDEDLLEEAYVEHDGAKVLIAELLESKPEAEFYDAKVTVLSELIKHHVKEEEKRAEGIFAEAKEAGLDLEALGERLEERKQALLKQFAGGKLPPPQTRSYTGHKLVQAHPVEVAA